MKQIKPSPHRRFTPACVISPRHHTPKRIVFYHPAEPEQNFTIEVLMEANVFEIPITYTLCWTDWNNKLPESYHRFQRSSLNSPEHWCDVLSDTLANYGYRVTCHITRCEINQRLATLHFKLFKPFSPARYIKQNKAP